MIAIMIYITPDIVKILKAKFGKSPVFHQNRQTFPLPNIYDWI